MYSHNICCVFVSDRPSWLLFGAGCAGSAVMGALFSALYVHCRCTRKARKKLAKVYLQTGGGRVEHNRGAMSPSEMRLSPLSESGDHDDEKGSDADSRRAFAKERIAKARAARVSLAEDYAPKRHSQVSLVSTSRSTSSAGPLIRDPISPEIKSARSKSDGSR